MKKILGVALLLITLFSCSNEVEFNTPFFEAKDTNDQIWKATEFQANISDTGALSIVGILNNEKISLHVPSAIAREYYYFGDVPSMYAEAEVSSGTYLTSNTPDPSIQIYDVDGFVKDLEIDYIEQTFTGTFQFNAFSANGLNYINFKRGSFYKIPLTSGVLSITAFGCADAQAAAILAQENLETTGTSDSAAYVAACEEYAAALLVQMNYCGDLDDSIQATIDSLNDCIFTCEMAEENTANAQADFANATLGNYISTCTAYRAYLMEQIQYCGDDSGALQAAIDNLDCDDDDSDGVANVLEDVDMDGDITNDDSDSDLNPNYLDNDDDDDLISTADELMLDEDGNPADTDGDNIPNYLDTDDDGDGILTVNEDLNGDGNPSNDDTDGDDIPNYLDNDDDGDTIFTQYENPDPNADGVVDDAQDTDGDTVPDYLDLDDDGDSVHTQYEMPDSNGDGNPAEAQNFDGDTMPDYLDNDDDDDGTPTIDENPDPNGDGNPDDAQNTDTDTAPDYLDANN